MYTRTFRKPCTFPGQDVNSEKTSEDPKLSPLADHWAWSKQEVKVKAEFKLLAKCYRSGQQRASL